MSNNLQRYIFQTHARIFMIQYHTYFLIFFCVVSINHALGQEDFKIRKITFKGNDSISEEVLIKQINTAQLTLVEKSEFWKKKARFSQYTLDEDIVRLKKFYQQNGFIDPIITFQLIPNKRNKKIKIEILIVEGPPILNETINYHFVGDSTLKNSINIANKAMPLKQHQRFRDEDVLESEKIIKETYSDNGYPYATVEKKIQLNESLHSVNSSFSINSGSKAYFGEVILQGDSLIPRAYILKRVTIQPNAVFSQEALDQTQQELFDTGLFRYITIKTKLDSLGKAKVSVVIQVKEMPRWAFKVGLGYGSEDKVRLSLLLSRLNFLGGGRQLIFKAQHSYFVPLSLDTKFIQPDIFIKNIDLIINPFFSWEREESYDVERLGTAVTFQKNINRKSFAYLTYNLGRDKVDLSKSVSLLNDETPVYSKNTKSGLTFGFKHDSSNDMFSPTKGWKFNSLATYMGIGFKSEYHYYKLMAEGNYFLPIYKRLVFASKLKAGVIEPVQGDVMTPIEDRFLMGGALSLRGWSRNEISPETEDGVKIGGNTMVEASAEIRFPIYGIVSGTTFIDFGNAWKKSYDINLDKLLYNFGLGLRISTPIGPIRLDVATPILDQKFDALVFITIGHSF